MVIIRHVRVNVRGYVQQAGWLLRTLSLVLGFRTQLHEGRDPQAVFPYGLRLYRHGAEEQTDRRYEEC